MRKFARTGISTKRLAPVNMRKEEHQFVIDGYLVDEVLSQIPVGITIIGAMVRLSKGGKNHKVVVPNALRKLGVSSMWERGSMDTAQMVFDQINKETIKQKLLSICRIGGYDKARAQFRYIVLANKEASVKFVQTTKEIKPDETDLRKKLRVLGATIGQGKVQGLIAQLNAKKYRCVIKEEPVKFVMCYKD